MNLITLTQTDDELLDALSLDKNDLFDTSIPKKVNIQSSRSGDPYDGNPPASKEEQKDRMKYIINTSAKPCEIRRNQKPFVQKRAHFVQIMRRRTILVVW